MRRALIAFREPVSIHASATPPPSPRDRTTRIAKALTLTRDAWRNAYAIAQEKGLGATKANRMAAIAYKLAMPKMEDVASIKAYIATIAQGIQLEVFDGRDGSQLLYAAQVAMQVHQSKGAKK